MSRILVVDDNALALEGTAAVLRSIAHEVVVARDAEAALRELVTGEFDVLLTDLELPGQDGWELATRARVLCPPIRIFLMTGWAIAPNDARARDGTVERVFLKPVDSQELLDHL